MDDTFVQVTHCQMTPLRHKFPKSCMEQYGGVLKRLKEIDSDPAIRQRIEVELLATHGF